MMQLHNAACMLAGKFLLLLTTAVSPVFAQDYTIYFGDLHSHTSRSDGEGTPWNAYAQAREHGADFFAVTDHSWFGYNVWEEIKEAADQNSTDAFVGIRGFELTMSWGHTNIYNTKWYVSEIFDLRALYSLISDNKQCIAQWNHPADQGEFGQFSEYSPETDSVIHLLEVYNGKRDKFFISSYIKALDKGWHVSPAANSDNHFAQWIKGYDYRTAILATGLTVEELFAAIRKQRTYATEDKNLRIHYFINGAMMGSVLPDTQQCFVKINIHDPDTLDYKNKIKTVEIITGKGHIAASLACNDHTVEWDPVLKKADSVSAYYFLKITNNAGKIAITAPIWVKAGTEKKPDDKPEKTPVTIKAQVVYDISGRLVTKLFREDGDSRNLPSGVYIIRTVTNGNFSKNRCRAIVQ